MVQLETVREGDGRNFPQVGRRVELSCHGVLPNQSNRRFMLESSLDKPLKFRLGEPNLWLVKGLEESIPKMSVGQKVKITCSPDEAYGEKGIPPLIPPNSPVVFEAELLRAEF